MTFEETTWNEGAAPGISAAELNRIEDGILVAQEVENYNTDEILVVLTTDWQDVAGVNLTIPSHWNTWDAFFLASYVYEGHDSINGFNVTTMINGSQSVRQRRAYAINAGEFATWDEAGMEGSFFELRTGLAVTGLVSFRLRAKADSSGAVEIFEGVYWARARRAS